MSNTTAINTAARAVVALEAALDAVRAAYAAAPDSAALAAAVAVTAAAMELANQGLDNLIGDESINWAPGMCESLVAGE